ncbi:MAG: LCP family protein [Eggerthellaceae bacterium]
MFGNRKYNKPSRRPKHGTHGRKDAWSSSVIGTHANGSPSVPRRGSSSRRNAYSGRRPGANVPEPEINQIHFKTRSVDGSMAARSANAPSRTVSLMKRRNRSRIGFIVVLIVLVVAIAGTLGTCAFRNSLSSNMALNDPNISGALVAPQKDQPYYTLIVGINDKDPEGSTASYVGVLRVDAQYNTISLLNIPSAIAESYDGVGEQNTMLRDAPRVADEGVLVHKVSDLLQQDINHYVRITATDFEALVDALGGLQVNVDTYVDDPTVGTTVLDPGQQTLNGEQALAYVSAKNYSNGFNKRASVQNQVFQALVSAVQEKGGIGFVLDADNIAGKIKTDMDYDTLNSIAAAYGQGSVNINTVPGSQSVHDGEVFWSVSSDAFNQLRDQFKGGQSMDLSVDTSGVDKSSVSIVVLNGVGTDGLSAQAAQKLTDAGYTVQETGNAESFVYDETLVIYRDDKDKLAAESIVQTLGAGRAISAGVYYNLHSDIQVVIGKDWVNHV